MVSYAKFTILFWFRHVYKIYEFRAFLKNIWSNGKFLYFLDKSSVLFKSDLADINITGL
jgi:hypothetical protein